MNGDRGTPQWMWDRFIDDLDRAGQAGSAADVTLPALASDLPTGTKFGDLTREDLKNLSRLANSLGRRSDVVTGTLAGHGSPPQGTAEGREEREEEALTCPIGSLSTRPSSRRRASCRRHWAKR